MENREIIRLLRLAASLMELHDENQFKIRSYTNAAFALERLEIPVATMAKGEMEKVDGVGKSMAGKITDIITNGTFPELAELVNNTPEGVIRMMGIKGIGPKKIRALWQEMGLTSPEELLQACQENKVSKLKGFGEKTQQSIIESLLYVQSNEGKLHFSEAEIYAVSLIEVIKKSGFTGNIEMAGALRRKEEIIESIEIVVGSDQPVAMHAIIDKIDVLTKSVKDSGPFVWRGAFTEIPVKVEIRLVKTEQFWNQLFINTGANKHLSATLDGTNYRSLLHVAQTKQLDSEAAIYEEAGLPYMEPELREGLFEFDMARAGKMPRLVEMNDLKGILHNHSTWSDGKHSLREMALYCKELGYSYLGISDHSKTAFYANGLQEERVLQQQEEIDRLNKELAPFRIFKGIESDINNDGSLDYDNSILTTFDFIVASIHGNLKMDIDKATARLITAIENPYTTILGHPTGRLLLKREGYPIDHKTVIDACAANGVVVEINANPWRLDLEWRWVHYALEKGVMISINPDAHEKDGYADMYYGLCVGRKAGLTKEMTFNALSVEEIAAHFEMRKSRIK